jgi:hypothetical protein
MVAPCPTVPGYLDIPCKRGDKAMAPGKPKQIRLYDGMCGGYLKHEDWKMKPTISPHSQGETLWIRVPATAGNLAFAKEAGQPVGTDLTSTKYRCMKHWIDFQALAPHVEAQCPNFLERVYKHKEQIPVIQLDAIPAECIKLAKDIDINRALIGDVGQITTGIYTIGPAGAHYPTYGGAGGGYAALGNLTGNFTFHLTGSITETASALITETLGGFAFSHTSSVPHYGNPTQGWLIEINATNITMFDLQQDNAGTFNIGGLHLRWTGAANVNNHVIYPRNIAFAANQTLNISDNLIDGNALRALYGIRPNDLDVMMYIWNNVLWECQESINVPIINPAAIIANNAVYNGGGNGIAIAGAATYRNNIVYGSALNDFVGTGNATGWFNKSSDGTAANGLWLAGNVGNEINGVAANDVQSVVATEAAFFDLIRNGPLDGAGEANAIARATDIRNRRVPGPRGTSKGPAEALSVWPIGKPRMAMHAGMGM